VRIYGERKLQVVLDSNEYIFGFGPAVRPECLGLLEEIAGNPAKYRVRIPRTIIEEVGRNLSPERNKAFWSYVNAIDVKPDEDWLVPFELGARYEARGLTKGDAYIAAYVHWTGADCLVTENRDFHDQEALPFEILRAGAFLKHYSARPEHRG